MSDLMHVDPAMMLESAADPGEFVVQCLERGKTWLAEALEHNDLDALTNMKGYAATLRVATMQKELGNDAVLSATELVRRAERAIGIGVRQGQCDGTVMTHGDNGGKSELVINQTPKRPVTDFASHTSLSGAGGQPGYYDLSDNVTDEQFDAAIVEAKAEGNLSRANVARKVGSEKAKPKPATRHEIHHRARHVNAARIVEETIAALDGLAMGLALIDDIQSIDAAMRREWQDAMTRPLAAINTFKRELTK